MDANDIATKQDIEHVLDAIKQLQLSLAKPNIEQKFLRSADVRKLLNISDGTLQRLRTTSTLSATKVNGTWFYKYVDVLRMIESNHD